MWFEARIIFCLDYLPVWCTLPLRCMVKYSQRFAGETLDCGPRLTRIDCSAPPKT